MIARQRRTPRPRLRTRLAPKARASARDGLRFLAIASAIAKGPPPEWLALALEHWAGFIGAEPVRGDVRRQGNEIIKQMREAVDTLLRWLPALALLAPNAVGAVLDALPRIMKELDRLNAPRAGRPRIVQCEICAAVVLQASAMIHGAAHPRSGELMQACEDYWVACGGAPLSSNANLENWRRPLEQAQSHHFWLREILAGIAGTE